MPARHAVARIGPGAGIVTARTANNADDPRDVFVRVRGLTFAHGNRVVFDRVNMDVPRGRVTAILGPAGAGKTTLLRLFTAQLAPAEGRIDVDGRDVHALDRRELHALRRRMGVMFQSGALLDDLDVFENVALPLREHADLPEPLLRQLVVLHLESVGARAARRLVPADLSPGTARRVGLARALALDPAMLVCDEPFAARDAFVTGALARSIRSASDAHGLTSIVASQDVAAALSIADYAYIVADGGIVGRGTPEQLRATESPWIRQFVQALPDGPVPFHLPGPELADELFGGDRATRGRRA